MLRPGSARLREFALWLLIALVALVPLLLWYAQAKTAPFGVDAAPVFHDGFGAVESFPDGSGTYRWTDGSAQLILPNPGGSPQLRVLLAGGPGRAVPLTLRSDAWEVRFGVSATPREYRLLLPPAPAERLNIALQSPTFTGPAGQGQLGVVVGRLGISAAGAPPLHLALIWVAMPVSALLVLRRAGSATVPAVGLPLALSMLLLLWHATGGWTLAMSLAGAALLAQILVVAALALWLVRNWPLASAVALRQGRAYDWLLVAGLLLFGGLALWNHLFVHPGLASDFAIYLDAAARADTGGNPYQPFLIGESFVYPPVALLWFVPLARLPLELAEFTWNLGNLVLFLLALLSLGISVQYDRAGTVWSLQRGLPVALVVALLYAPVWESLAIGQINSLMLLGMVLFVHGQLDRRLAAVGDAALALVIMVKVTPVLLLLWPLLQRDWRRILRVGLVLVGLVLLSWYCFGTQVWLQFLAILTNLLAGVPLNPFNQSIGGLASRLGLAAGIETPLLGLAGPLWSAGLLAGWLLLAWHGRRATTAQRSGLLLSCGIAVVTLASSLVWYHHLMLLLAPLAWLLPGSRVRAGSRIIALLGVGLIQATRLLEGIGMPAGLPAVAGYVLILLALALAVNWKQ